MDVPPNAGWFSAFDGTSVFLPPPFKKKDLDFFRFALSRGAQIMEIFGGSEIGVAGRSEARKIGNRESSMRGSRIRGPFGLKKIGYVGKLQKTGKTVHKKLLLLTPKLLLIIYNTNIRIIQQ